MGIVRRRITGIGAAIALVAAAVLVPTTAASADPPLTYDTMPGGDYPIDLEVSPDRAHLYVLARGDGGVASLRTYDTGSLELVGEIVFGAAADFDASSVEVTPDGTQVWVSFYVPGEVRIYPADVLNAGGTPEPHVITGNGGFIDLEADPVDPYMYAATLFNPQYQFAVPATIGEPVAVQTVDIEGGGSRGVAVDSVGGEVFFSVNVAAPAGAVAAFEVAPDGTLSTGTRRITGDLPWGVAYNPVEDRVVSTNSGTPTSLSAFTPGSSDPVTNVDIPCGPRRLDTGPAGQRVYIACLSGGIVVHDYADDTTSRVEIGDNVEAVAAVGLPGQTADRVYATSGGSDEVLVFTKPTVVGSGDVTVPVGATASFTATATGFWQDVRWQASRDGGASWSDIAGADADALDVPDVAPGDDGMLVRAIFSSLFFNDVVGEPMRLRLDLPPTPTPCPPPGPTPAPAPVPDPACVLPDTGADLLGAAGVAVILIAAALLALAGARARLGTRRTGRTHRRA